MCRSERYNSCAHKIKRKRVFKENRISTPPRRLAAVAGGRCNLVAAAYARTLSSRWFFFIYIFLSPKPSPRCLKWQYYLNPRSGTPEFHLSLCRVHLMIDCKRIPTIFLFFFYVLSFAVKTKKKKRNKFFCIICLFISMYIDRWLIYTIYDCRVLLLIDTRLFYNYNYYCLPSLRNHTI